MNFRKISFLLILFFCFSFSLTVRAANSLDAVINEIVWMGTGVSANEEWIELYNNTKNSINLEGWVLKSEDGTPEIKLTGVVPANGFFLLERTDDNTVPGIAADLIYKGALGNNGEYLKLFDSTGNLIDEVNCSSGWFAGDNKIKQTMERKSEERTGSKPANWQTSQNPGGTPKQKNSSGADTASQSSKETKTTKNQKAADSLVKSNQIIYPSGIILNEILPSPEGSDEKEEWIEIFNQNNFEVNLSNWQIKDTSGKITTYTFPEGIKISPQGFLVLSRPETKITLNNDEDGLILSSPSGTTIDEVNYKKAPRGQSYNYLNSEWRWSANLTPGGPNATEKTETRSLEDKEKRELAALGEQIPKTSKFLFIFLIALGLAIFSGAMILILKKKLKEPR